jgi:chromosome segregation ATPase
VSDDEMNENQDSAPEGEAIDEEPVSSLTELESLVAQKDEALASASARITELEQAIASLEERLEITNDSLAEAIASYQTMVTEANPEVPEEMISGSSIEAVNQSLAEAKSLISHVKQGLEAEIQATRVPVGAPQRMPPDLSTLSPREKIQHGIRR